MEGNSAIHFFRAAAVYDTRAGVQRAVAEKSRGTWAALLRRTASRLGMRNRLPQATLLDHYGQAVIDAVTSRRR